jgi:mRNA (guanine-N7-)-methyltransferase
MTLNSALSARDFAAAAAARPAGGLCVFELYSGKAKAIEKLKARLASRGVLSYIGIESNAEMSREASRLSKAPTDGSREPLTTRFFCRDPGGERLISCGDAALRSLCGTADLVASFARFSKVFSDEQAARTFVGNVATLLKPRGFFVGYVIDGAAAWEAATAVPAAAAPPANGAAVTVQPDSSGMELFRVRLTPPPGVAVLDDDCYPAFGTRLSLTPLDLPTQTHYLCRFSDLVRLARAAGLRLLFSGSFSELLPLWRTAFAKEAHEYGCDAHRLHLTPPMNAALALYTAFAFQK